jgi:hypothetical protein
MPIMPVRPKLGEQHRADITNPELLRKRHDVDIIPLCNQWEYPFNACWRSNHHHVERGTGKIAPGMGNALAEGDGRTRCGVKSSRVPLSKCLNCRDRHFVPGYDQPVPLGQKTYPIEAIRIILAFMGDEPPVYIFARTHADMKTPLNDQGGAFVLYNRLRRFGFTCEVSPTPWLYGTRITFFGVSCDEACRVDRARMPPFEPPNHAFIDALPPSLPRRPRSAGYVGRNRALDCRVVFSEASKAWMRRRNPLYK